MPRACRSRTGVYACVAIALMLLLPAGRQRVSAASPAPTQPPPVQADPSADPEQLLQNTLDRCDALAGYQITFCARERRGLLRSLADWEHVRIDYRRNPKAIKMAWLNSDSEYAQAVYIEGHNKDKIKVLPRRGLFGLTPHPFSVAPATPVSYGKSLRPITDIGLSELIRVTLNEMQRARRMGAVRIVYAGRSHPPDLHEPADHVVIHYPPGFADATRQDIYISTRTGYPIATYLWQGDGNLLATYLYGQPAPSASPVSQFRLS